MSFHLLQKARLGKRLEVGGDIETHMHDREVETEVQWLLKCDLERLGWFKSI